MRESSSPAARQFSADAGFSLIEVIVALAIMVLLAASITPSLVSALDRQRVTKGMDAMLELRDAVQEYYGDVQRWPRYLNYLASPVSTTDDDSCGNALPSGRAAAWEGPYTTRLIPTTGLPIFIGSAQDLLVRTPTSGGSSPTLTLRVNDVRLEDAEAIDTAYDGDGSASTGAVRWTIVAASGNVTLSVLYPISGC